MTMPMIAGDGILITRNFQKPGYAIVAGGGLPRVKEMTLEDAELLKDNFIRSKLRLEPPSDMPSKHTSGLRVCRYCTRPSRLRCSACRTKYCSKLCQSKHWKRHVFVCCVSGRPNDVDRLRLITTWAVSSLKGDICQPELPLALFSEDDLCKTFGFNNCANKYEVGNLICIYHSLMRMFQSVELQYYVDHHTLGACIEVWIRASQIHRSNDDKNHPCFQWFLSSRSEGFNIPNHEETYLHQTTAVVELEDRFPLAIDKTSSAVLSFSEKNVASLYSILLRDFNNIPTVHTSEWIDFDFCFCTSTTQREALAAAYLTLAEKGTPLSQIANSWETSSLLYLMRSQGIDISLFESNDIYLTQPRPNEFGIYRLMAEVKHALSGCPCPRFSRPVGACSFHPNHEQYLNSESDGNYGFHGTNAWERWQLLNFYAYVFAHPDFKARKMLEAKNKKVLDMYLDELVPDFRRKIGNIYLADLMFPKTRGSVRIQAREPSNEPLLMSCDCIIHSALTSEGLDWTVGRRVRRLISNCSLESD